MRTGISTTPRRKPVPKAPSEGEETFMLHWRARHGDLPVEREYQFALPRKFRFDFAWPEERLAVEIDGGTKFGKSRHSRGEGFENDCRKLNLAAKLGWRVLRYTTAMVKSGEAIADVEGLL
jgi:very-short-patch-repair endonuclease